MAGLLLPLGSWAPDEAAPTVMAAATASEPAALGSVVVTARKRNERTRDVPLPVGTISGEAIGKDGDYSIQNLAERVPKLLITPSNPRQTSISIRGLGKNSAHDGLETSVGVYVDQPGEEVHGPLDSREQRGNLNSIFAAPRPKKFPRGTSCFPLLL